MIYAAKITNIKIAIIRIVRRVICGLIMPTKVIYDKERECVNRHVLSPVNQVKMFSIS